jgi:hypothetical protein
MRFSCSGMSFSARQWLFGFLLDAVIKFVLLALAGALVTFGMVAWWSWSIPAVVLSLFHFLCLFLGFSLVASLEIIKVDLGPATKFWLGLSFANLLFAAAVNTFHALEISRASVFELSSWTVVLVGTNLASVLTVAACNCLCQRIKRSRASDELAG